MWPLVCYSAARFQARNGAGDELQVMEDCTAEPTQELMGKLLLVGVVSADLVLRFWGVSSAWLVGSRMWVPCELGAATTEYLQLLASIGATYARQQCTVLQACWHQVNTSFQVCTASNWSASCYACITQ